MKPRFFRSAGAFRTWLEKNHATERELIIGFYKKGSRRGGLTYAEAVDESLCFGWIDGVVKTIDEDSYQQRYSPRKAKSNWSGVNIAKVKKLKAAGKMAAAGLAAFEGRDRKRDAPYSYEREHAKLSREQEQQFKNDATAWTYWRAQPAGYVRLITFWVTSAKKAETQARRLSILIEACRAAKRLR